MTFETLENTIIEMETVILTGEQIKVTCDHTNFVSHSKVQKYDLKQVIKLHAEIVKLCKDNKIKVSYKNKTKAYLTEIMKDESYEQAYTAYNDVYNTLLNGWINKLEKGLYTGYGDDKEYTDVLRDSKFAIDKMFYNGTVLSKVGEIVYRLNELKENLESCPEEYISIAL